MPIAWRRAISSMPSRRACCGWSIRRTGRTRHGRRVVIESEAIGRPASETAPPSTTWLEQMGPMYKDDVRGVKREVSVNSAGNLAES